MAVMHQVEIVAEPDIVLVGSEQLGEPGVAVATHHLGAVAPGRAQQIVHRGLDVGTVGWKRELREQDQRRVGVAQLRAERRDVGLVGHAGHGRRRHLAHVEAEGTRAAPQIVGDLVGALGVVPGQHQQPLAGEALLGRRDLPLGHAERRDRRRLAAARGDSR